MNELEFYKNQVSVWGVEYVEDLVERGYAPKLTEHGYRWVYMPDGADFLNRGVIGTHGNGGVDKGPTSCYARPVGA